MSTEPDGPPIPLNIAARLAGVDDHTLATLVPIHVDDTGRLVIAHHDFVNTILKEPHQ